MAFQATETHAGTDIKPFWQQYRLFHAAFAQFCYTGAQIAIAGYFVSRPFQGLQRAELKNDEYGHANNHRSTTSPMPGSDKISPLSAHSILPARKAHLLSAASSVLLS